MIDIRKNFLEDKDFIGLRGLFMSNVFPWFLSGKNQDALKEKDFQFVHIFYEKNNINSQFFDWLNPLLNKIKPFSIIRIKANLLTRTSKIVDAGMHTDFTLSNNKITTGIYYLDDSNGYTNFEKGDRIKSESNKYVSFDSKLKHCGSTCTDKDFRMVINLNYIDS